MPTLAAAEEDAPLEECATVAELSIGWILILSTGWLLTYVNSLGDF